MNTIKALDEAIAQAEKVVILSKQNYKLYNLFKAILENASIPKTQKLAYEKILEDIIK